MRNILRQLQSTPSALYWKNKEKHLFNTMQAFQWQDSLLQEQEPAIAEQTKNFRTVTRKKKGIAGFFGAKETIQLENQNIRYPKWELLSIIDPAFEVIIEALARDEEVHLNKFGRFSIKHKKGARIYNINTGQKETAPRQETCPVHPAQRFPFHCHPLKTPAPMKTPATLNRCPLFPPSLFSPAPDKKTHRNPNQIHGLSSV